MKITNNIMQKYAIILFLLLLQLKVLSQKKIDGKYYHEYGTYIEIIDDHFKMISPNSNVYYSNILAEGIIKPVDKNFIELNSQEEPFIEATKSLKIKKETDASLSNDSLKIKFSIPYTNDNLIIIIFTPNFKQFRFNYSSTQSEFTIPFQGGSISFLIYPSYTVPHTPEGSFYGVLEYNTLEFDIKRNINYVEVDIPAINNSFFEKYYFNGEYARIIDNKIIWKGKVYKKALK